MFMLLDVLQLGQTQNSSSQVLIRAGRLTYKLTDDPRMSSLKDGRNERRDEELQE